MFAPYCPDCRRRVLLGPRRLVEFSCVPGGDSGPPAAPGSAAAPTGRAANRVDAVLACFCGRLVAWNAAPPPRPEAPRPPAQRARLRTHGPLPCGGDPLTCT